jgi:gas vesicle protein
MKCKDSNFWIGLGIGSVAGALAYHFSRTEKAKKLEDAICRAIHKASGERSSSTLLKKKHCTLAPK